MWCHFYGIVELVSPHVYHMPSSLNNSNVMLANFFFLNILAIVTMVYCKWVELNKILSLKLQYLLAIITLSLGYLV